MLWPEDCSSSLRAPVLVFSRNVFCISALPLQCPLLIVPFKPCHLPIWSVRLPGSAVDRNCLMSLEDFILLLIKALSHLPHFTITSVNVLSSLTMLPNASSCAPRTMRPNKQKCRSLEQRIVYCRAMKEMGGSCSKNPQTP